MNFRRAIASRTGVRPIFRILLSSLSEIKEPGASLPPTIISSMSSKARSASDCCRCCTFSAFIAHATHRCALCSSFSTPVDIHNEVTSDVWQLHIRLAQVAHYHLTAGERQGSTQVLPGDANANAGGAAQGPEACEHKLHLRTNAHGPRLGRKRESPLRARPHVTRAARALDGHLISRCEE